MFYRFSFLGFLLVVALFYAQSLWAYESKGNIVIESAYLDSLVGQSAIPDSFEALKAEVKEVDNDRPYYSLGCHLKILQEPYVNTLTSDEQDEYLLGVMRLLGRLRKTTLVRQFAQNLNAAPNSLRSYHKHFILGKSMLQQKNFSEAYRHLMTTKEGYEAFQYENLPHVYGDIADYYMHIEEWDKAIRYYELARNYVTTHNQSEAYILIANYIYCLYDALDIERKPSYINRVKVLLKQYEELVDEDMLFERFGYIAGYIHLTQYDSTVAESALAMVPIGDSISAKFEFPLFQGIYSYDVAYLMSTPQVKDYRRALQYLGQAQDFFITSGSLEAHKYLLRTYKLQGDIYYQLGDTQAMETAYQKYEKTVTDLYGFMNVTQREAQAAKRASAAIDYEHARLAQKNKYLFGIGIALAAVILIVIAMGAYIAFLYMKNSKSHQEIDTLNNQLIHQIKLNLDKNEKLNLANSDLESSNQTKQKLIDRLRKFAFLMVHDFKEPMRTIAAYSGLLQIKANDKISKKESDYLLKLTAGANQLNGMLDVLKKYNISTIALLKEAQKVDLEKTILEVLDRNKPLLSNKKIETKIEGVFPVLMGQKELLHQLFQYWVNHVIRYSSHGDPGFISIKGICSDDQYRIIWSDNTMTLSNDQCEMIYREFGSKLMKHWSSQDRIIELALCQEILELNDMKFTIDNATQKSPTGNTYVISFDYKMAITHDDALFSNAMPANTNA